MSMNLSLFKISSISKIPLSNPNSRPSVVRSGCKGTIFNFTFANKKINFWSSYPGRDLNPHVLNGHRILSPACLPISPPGPVSGKRDSNSRPQPWQGCALPTELFPQKCFSQWTPVCDGRAKVATFLNVARAVLKKMNRNLEVVHYQKS